MDHSLNSETPFFTPVKTLDQAQTVRRIRNACRLYMTRDISYISEDQQEAWFSQLNDDIKLFLMNVTVYPGVAYYTVGFGYVVRSGDEAYLTGGLMEQYRGLGYGKKLFLHLLETAKSFNTKRITLEVLNTNVVAERLYKSIGFLPYYKDERITKMEYISNDTSL